MVAANDATQPQRAPELAVAGEALRSVQFDFVATGVSLVSEQFSNSERGSRDRQR